MDCRRGWSAPQIGYAVTLPQADLHEQPIPPTYVDLTAGEPVSITIDRNDLSRLGQRVLDLLRYWHGMLRTPPLTAAKVRAIVDAICPVANYRPRWADRITEDAEQLLVLIAEQARCLAQVAA